MKWTLSLELHQKPKINVLAKAIDKGLMTINEGRNKMELAPIEGGDQTLVMANNLVPLSELKDFVDSKMK